MPHPNNRSRSNAERSGARMQGASRSAAASRRASSARTPESLAPSEQTFENVTASEIPTALQTSPHATASTTTMAQGLMFITVNNPNAFKDKKTQKAARTQVMLNFLGQKRPADSQPQAEPSRNRRRTGSNGSRTASSRGTPGTQGPSTAPEEPIIDRETALSIYRREPRRRQVTISSSPSDGQAQTSPSGSTGSTQSEPAVHAAQQSRSSVTNSGSNSPQNARILEPHGARESHYYRSHQGSIVLTFVKDIKEFTRCLGLPLDPFAVLPRFSHPSIETHKVYELKHHCERPSSCALSLQPVC